MMDADVIRKLLELERRLDGLALPEKGWVPHFLTTPYTNTDFDGDSFSDVAANTKIENTSWSTTIPADAKALLIRVMCRDSDSANTNGLYVALFGAAAATVSSITAFLNGIPNDQQTGETGIVPCTDGDIWYQVNASGASTMDIFLWCFGYWT